MKISISRHSLSNFEILSLHFLCITILIWNTFSVVVIQFYTAYDNHYGALLVTTIDIQRYCLFGYSYDIEYMNCSCIINSPRGLHRFSGWLVTQLQLILLIQLLYWSYHAKRNSKWQILFCTFTYCALFNILVFTVFATATMKMQCFRKWWLIKEANEQTLKRNGKAQDDTFFLNIFLPKFRLCLFY